MIREDSMGYDFYAHFSLKDEEDIKNLTNATDRFLEIEDVFIRTTLLATALSNDELKDYAKVGERNLPFGLKALIHSYRNYNDYIMCKLSELNLLGINMPINTSNLPEGSWVIEIPLTLKKPFYSKDDIPLYIIENPVRKDKVFAIPLTSAMSWKGNLRWVMMKTHLEPKINDPEEFFESRFRHTLLFGTEKGMEENPIGWANYLDNLCSEAKERYRNRLKEFFETEDIPSNEGMLYFYPTFWNKIDLKVINPLDRKTKTGKNPIYYEVVPKEAKGIFRLVYVPVRYIGRMNKSDFTNQILTDLKDVVEGLEEMMLHYGFSAKKTLGYGVIKDSWDEEQSRFAIKHIRGAVSESKFVNFNELKKVVNNL